MATIISLLPGIVRVWVQDQRGLGLVESVAVVAILVATIVAFVLVISAGSIAAGKGNEEAVSQSLARTHPEHIKSYRYDPEAAAYPTVDTPEDYTISVEVSPIPEADIDADIQKIAVTISPGGEELMTVQDYKVNR